MARMKTSKQPALIPGIDCGRYTLKKAVIGLAPMLEAARMSDGGIFFITL